MSAGLAHCVQTCEWPSNSIDLRFVAGLLNELQSIMNRPGSNLHLHKHNLQPRVSSWKPLGQILRQLMSGQGIWQTLPQPLLQHWRDGGQDDALFVVHSSTQIPGATG